MKKNILQVNRILTSVKEIASTREREYIRLVWAITNHVALHSVHGKEQEAQIMTDLCEFVNLLNQKYPVGSEEHIGLDNSLKPDYCS